MLTFDDEVYSVGSNVYGQLGHGHLNSCTVPKKVFGFYILIEVFFLNSILIIIYID